MPDSPRLRRIAAVLLSATAGVCALPAAGASANIRHDQRARCEVHAVVVRGEISGPAASGASSFTANVWSVRVFAFHPGADSPLCAAPAATGTGTTSGSSTSICPVPAGSSLASTTATGVAKGVTINTASATRVMMNGAPSSIGSLPHGDHFVALFLVPACAGDGSNSGIPAILVAAWPPHSGQPADSKVDVAGMRHGDRHAWWNRDWWRHDHHPATRVLVK